MATGHRSIPDRNAERMEAARAYRRLHTGMAQAVADSLTLAHRCAHRCAHRYLVKGASQWDFQGPDAAQNPHAQDVWPRPRRVAVGATLVVEAVQHEDNV